MTKQPFQPAAFLTGAVAALLALAALGFRAPQSPQKWEFKVTNKHSDKILEQLGEDGWDYAGYFGESQLGGGEAIGLWKRPK